jgi:hypothetical protein
MTILSDKTTSIKRDEVLKWFGNRDEFLKFHQNADEAQRNEQLSKSLKLLES